MVGESSGGEPGGCGSLFGVCVCGWAFVRWVVLMLILSAQSQGCNLVVAGQCVYVVGGHTLVGLGVVLTLVTCSVGWGSRGSL